MNQFKPIDEVHVHPGCDARPRRRAARAASAAAALLVSTVGGGGFIGGCGASADSTQSCAGSSCAGAGGAEPVQPGAGSGGTALGGGAGGAERVDAGVSPVGPGLVVTITNERHSPIYFYSDPGCYDPLETVVALHRSGEWVDVFGSVCEPEACSGAAAGSSGSDARLDAGSLSGVDGGLDGGSAADAGDECVCPFIGMVKLDAGATLVIGPLVDEFSRGGVGPSAGGAVCGRRPLPAGEYTLEVDATSGLDPYCGPGCDCAPDASGACVTRAQAGDGSVMNQTQVVRLPAGQVSFRFREE